MRMLVDAATRRGAGVLVQDLVKSRLHSAQTISQLASAVNWSGQFLGELLAHTLRPPSVAPNTDGIARTLKDAFHLASLAFPAAVGASTHFLALEKRRIINAQSAVHEDAISDKAAIGCVKMGIW
jgi:hypothetical protein